MREQVSRWAIQWNSISRLDGHRSYLIRDDNLNVMLFATRDEARRFNKNKYGYIKERGDLRAEPHGWKMPKVVRVIIDYNVGDL